MTQTPLMLIVHRVPTFFLPFHRFRIIEVLRSTHKNILHILSRLRRALKVPHPQLLRLLLCSLPVHLPFLKLIAFGAHQIKHSMLFTLLLDLLLPATSHAVKRMDIGHIEQNKDTP